MRIFDQDVSARDLLFTRDFEAGELRRRRQRLAQAMEPEAVALVASAEQRPDSLPLQDANFYYLTGLETSRSLLLLRGDGHATLFLPSREVMSGAPEDRLGFEDAEEIAGRTGVDAVRSVEALQALLEGCGLVYTPFAEAEGGGVSRWEATGGANRRAEDLWDQTPPRHQTLIRLLEQRVAGVTVRDACPLIDPLRRIKSPAELAVLRQAGELSALALIESMKATRPGICENRLQAIAEYVFRDRGHCGTAYPCIVATGRNSWDGHYHRNNTTLAADDMVLMDCAPDLRHYASDICRIWPVSGAYRGEYRRVYGFIVAYHKVLLDLIRPGESVDAIYAEADRIMAARCRDPGFVYGDMRWIHDKMVARGVSYLNHAVGMSAHDPARGWREEPLREGFVVAVDPMVWWDEEQLYVRVEDTVAVTSDGVERLTGLAPLELDEVEQLMTQPSRFDD